MAGESTTSQIGQAFDPRHLPSRQVALLGNLGAFFVSEHTFAALAAGVADDVTLVGAATPIDARVAAVVVNVTDAVGGSNVQLRTAAGGAGDALSDGISSATAVPRIGCGLADGVLSNGSVYLRRSDRGAGGTLLILWWVPPAGAGTTDLPGVIKQCQMVALGLLGSGQLARESATGFGVPYLHASSVAAGADVALAAVTPAKSRLACALVMITNPGAGGSSCTIRNEAAAAGDTLATFATDAAGLLVVLGGATPTIAGKTLYCNKSDAAATLDVLLLLVPVS